MINEDDNYVYYEATVTGTSTFAVVGGKVVDMGEEPEPTDITMPWFAIIGAVIAIIVLIVVSLFKAGFLYVEEKPGKKGKQYKPDKKKK